MLMQTTSKKLVQNICLLLPAALSCSLASAGDITLQPAVAADYYNLSVDFVDEADQPDISESVYKIAPSFSAAYDSKKLRVSSNLVAEKTTHSEQKSHNSSFVSYGVQGQALLIENLLTLDGSINKSFRSASSQIGGFNDSIFGSEELVGVTNSSVGLNLAAANSNMLQLRANVQLQRSKADENIDLADFGSQGISRYDTKSASAGFAVSSQANSRVIWNLSGQATESDRSQTSNYRNSTFAGELTVPVTSELAITTNGSVNKNSIADDQALSDGLTYKQYGAGLRWSFAKQSYLSLLGYRSQSGEQETRSFIGGEFNWVLSSRTQMSLTADRNQFGEQYGFSLTQASRFVRTQMSYSEGVDIQSRNNFISTQVGSFICPDDVLDLSQCYVPEDLNYQPALGEQQVNIFGRDIELVDVVSRFETGQVTIAYDNQRKLKLSAGLNYSERVALEDSAVGGSLNRKSKGYSLSADYAMSSKTSVTLSNSLSRNTYLNSDGVATDRVEDNKMWQIKLTSARSSSLNLTASLSQRESNRLGQAYTDKRLQLGVSYTFN
ncbi:hypothetical protein DS2_04875 [Catenovulum agarivorans DS-2]|uniref:TIGR03016 family PEP-CTERM system-associated outer membrane protein n=1 Tax=Catenovulum agarivorans DS-2 TaxID=1328313 RepID=W7QQB4_9ALTE|nr:hypothetical protein [Catenovulum agarivorans]EWH11162.1 hypothetical protein DS2_04875 [Catenovulum agarivorans DS-2]